MFLHGTVYGYSYIRVHPNSTILCPHCKSEILWNPSEIEDSIIDQFNASWTLGIEMSDIGVGIEISDIGECTNCFWIGFAYIEHCDPDLVKFKTLSKPLLTNTQIFAILDKKSPQ